MDILVPNHKVKIILQTWLYPRSKFSAIELRGRRKEVKLNASQL